MNGLLKQIQHSNILTEEIVVDQKKLTHLGLVTHICIGNLTIIGSDNGLLPDWRQAIIWTNVGMLLIGTLGTNFSKNFNQNPNIFIWENAFESVICEMAAILSGPQCVKLKTRGT